jgi:hypothetical protein
MTDIPDNLVFTTTAEAEPEQTFGPAEVRFLLDGVELTAHRPKQAALVMLARAGAARSKLEDQIDAVARFLDLSLDDESQKHVLSRLEDPEDHFGWGHIADIVYGLAEQWASPDKRALIARKRAQRA